MAFKRKSAKPYKKRSTKRRTGGMVSKRYFKTYMKHHVELKYQTSTLNNTTTAGTGANAKIMTIAQGDTDSTRDGDRLYIKGTRVKGRVLYNGSMGATLTQYIRLLAFQWYAVDSVAPTVANILNAVGTDGDNLYGMTNYDRNNQYKILWDKTFAVDLYNPVRQFKRKLRVPKRHRVQQFIAGGTDGLNQIYLLYICDTASTTAGITPTFTMQTFMTFTDS